MTIGPSTSLPRYLSSQNQPERPSNEVFGPLQTGFLWDFLWVWFESVVFSVVGESKNWDNERVGYLLRERAA